MAFGFDFGKDVQDSAVRSDYESGANHAHDFLAVHVLFLHHAKRVCDFFIGIRQQGEGQLEFVLKLLLRLGRVWGYAK